MKGDMAEGSEGILQPVLKYESRNINVRNTNSKKVKRYG